MTSRRGRLKWIKASSSMGSNACVELARIGELIALRDSKNPDVQLQFTHKEIIAWLHGAKTWRVRLPR